MTYTIETEIDMGLKENKALVIDFFDAVARCDTKRMDLLMTSDATWWVAPSTVYSGLHQKRDFLALLPTLFTNAAGPLTFRHGEMTAEEDRVSLYSKGHLLMKDGKTYQCNYHFLLHVKDGKIASGQEWLDSAHVNDIFGPPKSV
jgi:ketosteroid isomerase-like protein